MDITGLTGHSGSGKTTVAKIMSDHGFYHIDCDRLVHEKVYTDKEVLSKISDTFGRHLVADGQLDRKTLAKLVFTDKTAYNKLMKLIEPAIFSKLEAELEQNKDKHILLDAPTLFEFGLQGRCTRIIGVVSDNAVERICSRDKIDESAAKLRLSNQKSADFYRQNCDITIENNEDIESLKNQTIAIAQSILKGTEL